MPRYGFIRTKEDIKFLVLYAMQFLDFPVQFEAIVDICTWCDDGFSYFELQEAFAEMLQSNHISQQPDITVPLYSITPLGRDAATVFEQNLPFTVRQSAQASALRVVRQIQRDAAISTDVTVAGEHDLVVQLDMQEVFSLRMHVVSASQASLLERNFRKHAEQIYHVILDALVREYPNAKDDDTTQ